MYRLMNEDRDPYAVPKNPEDRKLLLQWRSMMSHFPGEDSCFLFGVGVGMFTAGMIIVVIHLLSQ